MDWNNNKKQDQYDRDMDYFVFQETRGSDTKKISKKKNEKQEEMDKVPLWETILYIIGFLFLCMIIIGTGLGWLIIGVVILVWFLK